MPAPVDNLGDMNPQERTNSLFFSLDGPEVLWDVFLEGARSFNAILRSVESEVSGSKPGIQWVIHTFSKSSPLLVELVGKPVDLDAQSFDTVSKTVNAVSDGLRQIESEARRPKYFNDRALASTKALAELRDRNVTSIRVRNGHETVEVTKQMSVNVDELIGPKTSSEGTVEGKLEIVSIHGKSECSIFEPLTGNKVACYFPLEELTRIVGAFGKRVAVHGQIFATAAGKRLSVRIDSPLALDVFPSEDELPTIADITGIMGKSS